MDENRETYEEEYDSLNDVAEFQENMYNPGHYIATGRVPPTVSAPGNATPLAIACFIVAGLFLFLAVFTFMSYVFFLFMGITLLCIILGVGYVRKAKRYYKQVSEMESEPVDDTVEDKIWQRTCPECGKSHDIDYPKCPHCKFDYLNR